MGWRYNAQTDQHTCMFCGFTVAGRGMPAHACTGGPGPELNPVQAPYTGELSLPLARVVPPRGRKPPVPDVWDDVPIPPCGSSSEPWPEP